MHENEEQLMSAEIKAYFLPLNVTSLIQPLKQSFLENLKRSYREKLLEKLIAGTEEEKVIACLKLFLKLKNVKHGITEVWKVVNLMTLQKL